MDFPPNLTAAFYDELEKIAASFGRWRVSKSRAGRKPMSIMTLLRKEKDGTLHRHTGNAHKIAMVEPFLGGKLTGAEASLKKKKGDVPTKDELSAPKREDGRENATTVLGTGNFLLAPAGAGTGERSE